MGGDERVYPSLVSDVHICIYENFAGAGRDRWVTVKTCIL